MSDAEDPIRKSDLPTRFVMGVVMIAVAVAAVYLGGWWFRGLVAAAAALMLVEWTDMHGVGRVWAYIGGAPLVAALLGGTEYLYPVDAADWVFDERTGEVVAYFDAQTLAPNWIAFAALALASLVLGLVSRRLAMISGFLYVAIPAFALLSIAWVWMAIVLWVLVVTWATDIMAYFAGRSIGGPKLAPRISPNKTWAGLIGGMVGAGLFGWAVAYWFEMESLFLWAAAPMGLIAQLGDLYESWVKRRAGVKDSGSLLPGHGGVLDRLDGLLAVAVATALLMMAGLWTS